MPLRRFRRRRETDGKFERRKTDRLPVLCAVICILCALVVGVGGPLVIKTARDTADLSRTVSRNAASVSEFCDLVLNVHADKVRRYRNTLEYLGTRAGRERTALNDYIRVVSLPQTRVEVVKERRNLPPVCVAGRSLPAIPE